MPGVEPLAHVLVLHLARDRRDALAQHRATRRRLGRRAARLQPRCVGARAGGGAETRVAGLVDLAHLLVGGGIQRLARAGASWCELVCVGVGVCGRGIVGGLKRPRPRKGVNSGHHWSVRALWLELVMRGAPPYNLQIACAWRAPA